VQPIVIPEMSREAWLAARQKGLGASEIPSVIGCGFDEPAELYCRKVAPVPVDRAPTERMTLGTVLEPHIRTRYAEATGWAPSQAPALCVHPDRRWQLATPDGLVDGFAHLLECKAMFGPPGPDWGEAMSDQVPDRVLAQAQQQAGVCGSELVDVAVLFVGFEFRIYRVHFDRDLFGLLTDAGAEFMEHVERRRPIGQDWTSTFAGVIEPRLLRVRPGEDVKLDAAAEVLAAEFKELKRIEKEAADNADGIKKQLRAMVGEKEFGRFPGGGYVRRQIVERKPYAVEGSSYELLTVNLTTKKKRASQ
jgi:putative phage-type endonuclease